jgi:radical SAM superfamily enzyme YgiQ (UPF0313 family)
MEAAMPEIVLINPRFEVSYWGMEYGLPLLGKRCNMPVAALPLLGALTPPGFTVRIVDENVEPIDFDRCARADLVCLTGMIVQRFRMKEVLTELKRRGAFTVVGGPWVTVQEDYFGDLADVIFVGEAEQTWPQFLLDWKAGRHQRRYEQAERTDMSTVPPPKLGLVKMDRYMFGSVQFSRGCPFQCEFCDIIVTFGRRPRVKRAEQVLVELEALRARGMRQVFIVDDNLIGNKRAIKEVLLAVRDWQQARGYPLAFFTEASIDLADHPDLLALLAEINLVAVFVGIESPNPEALKETRKFQNVRKGGMLSRVHTIQRAGIDVWCGMIVGFDHDDPSVFQAQKEFILASRITNATISMLTALPKTPLYDRLAAEGRLDRSDRREFGTNVVPLRMGRDELQQGYLDLLTELYEPQSYFDRLDELFLRERMLLGDRTLPGYWKKHPWWSLRSQVKDLALALGLFARLLFRVRERHLRREYRKRVLRVLRVRRQAGVLLYYVIKCVFHYHLYKMAETFRRGRSGLMNTF